MPLDLEEVFGMNFFTLPPDLEFFFVPKISHYAPELREKKSNYKLKFFSICSGTRIFLKYFFHYASRLRKFSNSIHFTMPLDLEVFF